MMTESLFEKVLRTQGENNWQKRLGNEPIFYAKLNPFYDCPECGRTSFVRREVDGKDGLEIIFECEACGWAIDSLSGTVYC